uniref:Uncharacterized protein n=1 Tax=viral metagenome TaxID=1070528 RepID=A0A6M3Y5V3_9ZZZZ
MPYNIIKKQKDKYVVVNKETGDVKGTHNTYEKAVKQMRLLYGVKHGMVPYSRKKRE